MPATAYATMKYRIARREYGVYAHISRASQTWDKFMWEVF